eukprot:360555-Chlamydomonas_euryale.AAC.1
MAERTESRVVMTTEGPQRARCRSRRGPRSTPPPSPMLAPCSSSVGGFLGRWQGARSRRQDLQAVVEATGCAGAAGPTSRSQGALGDRSSHPSLPPAEPMSLRRSPPSTHSKRLRIPARAPSCHLVPNAGRAVASAVSGS